MDLLLGLNWRFKTEAKNALSPLYLEPGTMAQHSKKTLHTLSTCVMFTGLPFPRLGYTSLWCVAKISHSELFLVLFNFEDFKGVIIVETNKQLK